MAGSSSKVTGQQDAPDAFRHCLRERVRLARELAALRAGIATVAEHYERVLRTMHALGPSLGDPKSTRLNSSHSQISYAVFCLKKKNNAICRKCAHKVQR